MAYLIKKGTRFPYREPSRVRAPAEGLRAHHLKYPAMIERAYTVE